MRWKRKREMSHDAIKRTILEGFEQWSNPSSGSLTSHAWTKPGARAAEVLLQANMNPISLSKILFSDNYENVNWLYI